MTTWQQFHDTAPELAELVRGRFTAHGLGYLATLRRDGSPRITGIEPLIADGEVWLGMMPKSRKALDLQRDPRCALHNASTDKQVTEGDARISGRAIEHTSDDAIARARVAFEAGTGQAPPPGPMHLFSIDLSEVVFVCVEDDRLVIRSWTPDRGERRVERS